MKLRLVWVEYECTSLTHDQLKNVHKLEKIGHSDLVILCLGLIFCVHVLGSQVHMCARYEVSVIEPVGRRNVHRRQHTTANS